MSAEAPVVSVVIRAKDEAASIGRTLDLVAAQRVDAGRVEVIVVDSGSSDGTDAIARGAGARVIHIPAESFTFGGALNRGSQEARAPIIVALSAHAFPPDDRWLARMLEPFADRRVACASGDDRTPDRRRPLTDRITQDVQLAARHPVFGYSNGAGAFRADLWRARPFRTDLPASEDKEWAWHWLHRGRTVVVGPDLQVDHDHSKDSMLDTFDRARREWFALGAFVDLEPYRRRDVLAQWWSDQETYRSRARARLSHRRAARLTGRYVGQRAAARHDWAAAARTSVRP